jgi:hypothetical protein
MGLFSKKSDDEKLVDKIGKLMSKKTSEIPFDEVFELHDQRFELAINSNQIEHLQHCWLYKNAHMTHAATYKRIDPELLFEFHEDSLKDPLLDKMQIYYHHFILLRGFDRNNEALEVIEKMIDLDPKIDGKPHKLIQELIDK